MRGNRGFGPARGGGVQMNLGLAVVVMVVGGAAGIAHESGLLTRC